MVARMGQERKREQRRQENRHDDHADHEQWVVALRVLVFGWERRHPAGLVD
jgi:hypothetical protein